MQALSLPLCARALVSNLVSDLFGSQGRAWAGPGHSRAFLADSCVAL